MSKQNKTTGKKTPGITAFFIEECIAQPEILRLLKHAGAVK